MPDFKVTYTITETQFHEATVEADTEEQAVEMVEGWEFDLYESDEMTVAENNVSNVQIKEAAA